MLAPIFVVSLLIAMLMGLMYVMSLITATFMVHLSVVMSDNGLDDYRCCDVLYDSDV
jgi:hypothetical protein